MDISEILNWVLGGTSIAGIVGMFIYRHQNRKIKDAEAAKAGFEAKQSESEAEQSDIATQTAKIDLGNKYIQDSFAMMEMVKKSLDSGNENQKTMMRQLKEIVDKTDRLSEQNVKQDGLLTDIVGYLNGGFQEYQATHKKAASAKKKPAKKKIVDQ